MLSTHVSGRSSRRSKQHKMNLNALNANTCSSSQIQWHFESGIVSLRIYCQSVEDEDFYGGHQRTCGDKDLWLTTSCCDFISKQGGYCFTDGRKWIQWKTKKRTLSMNEYMCKKICKMDTDCILWNLTVALYCNKARGKNKAVKYCPLWLQMIVQSQEALKDQLDAFPCEESQKKCFWGHIGFSQEHFCHRSLG